MGKTKDLSNDCKNIVLNLFKFFQLEKARGRPLYSPDNLIKRTYKAASITYSYVYIVVNGKSPPESNRPKERKKERKLLMILTVALLNGLFIACTTGKLPQQSQKLRKNLKIQLKSRNQRLL
jgi:hypothetical protein